MMREVETVVFVVVLIIGLPIVWLVAHKRSIREVS